MFSHFDTIPACDRQTDGQTDVQPIAKTCFSIAADARKTKNFVAFGRHDCILLFLLKYALFLSANVKDTPYLIH